MIKLLEKLMVALWELGDNEALDSALLIRIFTTAAHLSILLEEIERKVPGFDYEVICSVTKNDSAE